MDIRTKDAGSADRERRSAIYLDPGLAAVIRKLARLEERTLDELLDKMVREFVRERPQYELSEDDAANYQRGPRRKPATGERRVADRRGTKKPVPGEDNPHVNRRREQRRK